MQVESRSIREIKPYEHNPRSNDGAVDAVAASIKEFGWQQPIVVDKDGVIIAGHTRYKAAKKLGLKEAHVVVAENLTEEQAKAYRLADNKTGELAEWDFSALEEELADAEAFNRVSAEIAAKYGRKPMKFSFVSFRGDNMVRIEEEREKIRRAKEIIRTTKSPCLKRDMQKYVRKAERQVKQSLLFIGE